MQNKILKPESASAARRVAERSLAGRRASAEAEIRRLIAAALELIRRDGRLEPRVGEIVRGAGLSNQAFYRHFRSKRELLVAVLDEGVGLLAGYLEHRMEGAATPEQAVREWLRGILAQALDPRGAESTRPFVLGRGHLAEAFPADVAASEGRIAALVRPAIAAAVASGRWSGADPERDAEALYHLAMGWVQARLQESVPPRLEDARALEAFALAGLARDACEARSPRAHTVERSRGT